MTLNASRPFGYLVTDTDWNDAMGQINSNESAIAALAASLSAALYPVGSIYTNASVSTNPSTLLGFGTWSAFGTGRVLVGFDGAQAEFNSLGATGGAKTHTLSSGEMPSHTHTQNSHNHTQDAHGHTQDAHTHTQNSHNHTQDSHNHTQDAHTHTQNSHDHNATTQGIPDPGGGSFQVATPGGGGVGASVAISTTPTNNNTTATNQATTATNQAATATNQNTTATNQNTTATNQAATATNQNTGGDGAHNNLQPYVTVYMWLRTA